MKRIIVVVLICLFMMVGCNKFDIGERSNVKVENDRVEFYVKEGTLNNTSATLVLKNKGDSSLLYGPDYELEVWKDKTWKKINVEIFFTTPLYGLSPGIEEELKFNWENTYGKLSRGKYRIIKEVYFDNEDKIYIGCEFEI